MQPSLTLPEWASDAETLRALQAEGAAQVSLRDGWAKPLRSIAGLAAVEGGDGRLHAAVVLQDAHTLALLEQACVSGTTQQQPLRDLHSFRVLPLLLEALSQLRSTPDLALLHGHGIAHPARFGLASHFGIRTGLASIGVSEAILIGETRMALHAMRGAFTPLRDGKTQIGWLLRSQASQPPVVVSPGHKVAMASAPELALRYTRNALLPEPLQLATQLATQLALQHAAPHTASAMPPPPPAAG